MDQESIRIIFQEAKAIISGDHFVYKSGKHGSAYVNKDAVYVDPTKVFLSTLEIANHFVYDDIEVVVGPAIGGVILSQWIAWHLSSLTEREVLSIYSEKEGDSFVIKRGYDKFLSGKNVLVVEDVVTTGGSVKKVIEQVLRYGGNVAGLGILCNRGNVSFDDVPKFFSLMTVSLDAWDEKECPLCSKGIPINTELGKGKQFLATHK